MIVWVNRPTTSSNARESKTVTGKPDAAAVTLKELEVFVGTRSGASSYFMLFGNKNQLHLLNANHKVSLNKSPLGMRKTILNRSVQAYVNHAGNPFGKLLRAPSIRSVSTFQQRV